MRDAYKKIFEDKNKLKELLEAHKTEKNVHRLSLKFDCDRSSIYYQLKKAGAISFNYLPSKRIKKKNAPRKEKPKKEWGEVKNRLKYQEIVCPKVIEPKCYADYVVDSATRDARRKTAQAVEEKLKR